MRYHCRAPGAEIEQAVAKNHGAACLERGRNVIELPPGPETGDLHLGPKSASEPVPETAPAVQALAKRTFIVVGFGDSDGAEHFALRVVLTEQRRRGYQPTQHCEKPCHSKPPVPMTSHPAAQFVTKLSCACRVSQTCRQIGGPACRGGRFSTLLLLITPGARPEVSGLHTSRRSMSNRAGCCLWCPLSPRTDAGRRDVPGARRASDPRQITLPIPPN